MTSVEYSYRLLLGAALSGPQTIYLTGSLAVMEDAQLLRSRFDYGCSRIDNAGGRLTAPKSPRCKR